MCSVSSLEKIHPITFLLAHGAGAGKDSAFMSYFAECLEDKGVLVRRFNFPYMNKMLETEKRRPPDRQKVLLDCFAEQIEQLSDAGKLVIGGKSMGGRIATILLADETGEYKGQVDKVSGCVCLGYPFHPPGKLDALRVSHLSSVMVKTLIVQGEKDAFGRKEEVESYDLPLNFSVSYIEGANHDLKSAKKLGFSHEEQIKRAAHYSHRFIESL